MATTVEITGDDRVIRDLKAKADRSVNLKPAMRDIADFAERQIRGVPVRTGRLERSARGGSDQLRREHDTGFELGTTVHYGRFVFDGTKHMRPRPPQINTNAIARNAADQINRELKRA